MCKQPTAHSGSIQLLRKLVKSPYNLRTAIPQKMKQHRNPLLALDVGERRIGVAIARAPVWIPIAHATLDHSETVLDAIAKIVETEKVEAIIVGLPRGLDGQETAQTQISMDFADRLAKNILLPIHLQDEALTSVRAKEVLGATGKPYNKGEVDSLAAIYILEDYLGDHSGTGTN
jgi:putative holliday junction resolvase